MKENKIHSVKYNFIMNFILTASQFLFPLITFPYISRVLQPAGNGKIAFVSSIANYFMLVASLGIPTYGIRACAQVRNDRRKLSQTVKEIFLINFAMTICVIVIYMVSVFCVPKFYAEKELFLVYGINILLNMFGMNWVFQALEQYDYITFRSILFKIIAIVLMFLFVHQYDDYVVYGAITVFAAVGSNILNFIRLRKYIDFKTIQKYHIKKHVVPILVLFAQSLVISVYTNLDTVMLGFIKTDTDVGYYNVAVKIKVILLSLVTSLGNVLLPRMSYYIKQNMVEDFKKTMLKALNFTALLAIPLVFYFVMYSKESICFLAGEGYAGAVFAMQLITIAIIPSGITGVLGLQVLTSLEKEKYVLYSVIVGAVVDFLLNMCFIPSYGAAGAAGATMVAEFVVLFVQIYYTRDLLCQMVKKIRIHIYLFLAVMGGILSYFVKCLRFNSYFLILAISAIVFFGIYGIGLILFKEENIMQMIYELRKKLNKK